MCLNTGIENELLLEQNCFWDVKYKTTEIIDSIEYEIILVNISKYNPNYKYYGDILIDNMKKEDDIELLYEEINDNIELFNINEDENYTIDNFYDELILFDFKFDKNNLNFLFDYFKSENI